MRMPLTLVLMAIFQKEEIVNPYITWHAEA